MVQSGASGKQSNGHTFEYDSVPVQNTLLFAEALSRFRVPAEVHLYPYGGHGLSLATEEVAEMQDSAFRTFTWPAGSNATCLRGKDQMKAFGISR